MAKALSKEAIEELKNELTARDLRLAGQMRTKIDEYAPKVRLKGIYDIKIAYEIERMARGLKDTQRHEHSGSIGLTHGDISPEELKSLKRLAKDTADNDRDG